MNKNGFTLIELIITLVISLIMFNMVTFSFVCVERFRIIQSANVLRTNLRYCQKNAMDEKRKYDISIDVNNNLYYIRRADDNSLLRKISQISLPPGIKIQTNAVDNSIAYTSQGTSGSACTIILKGKNYYLKMTINVGCGRVKIGSLQKLNETGQIKKSGIA